MRRERDTHRIPSYKRTNKKQSANLSQDRYFEGMSLVDKFHVFRFEFSCITDDKACSSSLHSSLHTFFLLIFSDSEVESDVDPLLVSQESTCQSSIRQLLSLSSRRTHFQSFMCCITTCSNMHETRITSHMSFHRKEIPFSSPKCDAVKCSGEEKVFSLQEELQELW